jgi:hypothetical protein
MEDMKGGLLEYVEYAVKVFCLTGDIDSALHLLSRLPEGHKKNLVLKRTARYLSLNELMVKRVIESNVLR